MKTFSISQFKAHALAIVQAVHDTGEGVIVAKRGKPLVQVMPFSQEAFQGPPIGRLKGTLAHEGDLVAPLADSAAAHKSPHSAKERGR